MSFQVLTDINKTPTRVFKLRAAAARTKGDLVRISTGHTSGVNVDLAIADDTNVYRVAVVSRDAASGTIYDGIIEGTCQLTVPSGTYTAGNGLKIHNGLIADTGSAAGDASSEVGDNCFGIVNVGGTTVTEITATLYNVVSTATT